MRSTMKLAVAALTLAAACGPLRTGSSGEQARVVFSNQSAEQADVYAVIAGTDAVRLGTVSSFRTDTLRVPTIVTDRRGDITISARLLARSGQPATGLIALRAGDVIRVRLSADARSLIYTPD